MTKDEYESAITSIINLISDIRIDTNDLLYNLRSLENKIENLPEISDIEKEE